jgi:hypothetical protein
MWVAVGLKSDTFNSPIAYSYDGICWKRAFKPLDSSKAYTVDWNGTIWVAGVDSSNTLIYSYNGDVWLTVTTLPSFFNCYTVVWNGTIWVAGGDNSILLYSHDGFNWYNSVINGTTFSIYYTAAWNGSMWLVGGTNQSPYIAYSYDGIIWDTANVINPPAFPTTTINGITWDGNKWIAVGDLGTIYYSYNGFEWTISSTIPTPDDLFGVAWNKNLGSVYIQQPVISLGEGDRNSIAYSLDGIKYTGLGSDNNNLPRRGYAAAWNGNMWVAVGEGGITTIIYSYDGIEWIPIVDANTYISQGRAVVWTGINWVITGYNGATTYIYYSSDGINWLPSVTLNPFPDTGACWGLATNVKTIVGGESSITVAVGNINSPGIVYSVDDGVSWKQANFPLPPVSTLYCVAWNGTTWLTGGDSSSQLYLSFDAINWNPIPINIEPFYSLIIRSIAWNGILWVVVCEYNNGIRIYYTSALDGQSGWTLVSNITFAGSPQVNLYSVIWNGKRWITGGQDISTLVSYIFVSHDGINWYESPPLTAPPNPYNNPINTSIYGLASNSRIGGVIVDSQIALNKNNSVNLTTKLDIYSDDYYNNGYNNMTVSIKSSDLL